MIQKFDKIIKTLYNLVAISSRILFIICDDVMRQRRHTIKNVVSVTSIILLTLWSVSWGDVVRAATTTVNVQITLGTVTISSPTTLSFSSTVSASFDAQTLAQEFTGTSNYFLVQDMKGADSGYNTTLQLSGNLTTWALSISSSNVQFKSSNSSVTLLSGTANPRVLIDSNATSYQSLNTARTFIYRNAQSNTGVIGKYGDTIWLNINIPANQAAGYYVGTLVYTLIEN